MQQAPRILFLTATRLGDAILSTSVLQYWLEQYPDARFTVACGGAPAPLFAACPAVDDVWVIRKQPYHGHWRELWKKAIAHRWDMVIDLRGSAFAWAVRSKQRQIFRATALPLPKTEQFRQAFGWRYIPLPKVWLQECHHQSATDLLPSGKTFLALGSTANWRGKQWPAERFADVAQQLTGDGGAMAGATVLIFAAPDETVQLAPLLERLPDAVILAGKADLPALAACLQRCGLYIGNDSGLMHLAAACGIPTLGLFGPSDERIYAPQGINTAWVRTPHSMQQLTSVPDYNHRTTDTLMTGLTVETVVKAAEELLA
jgi:ADP-heptose:LPS heptosyltransferase